MLVIDDQPYFDKVASFARERAWMPYLLDQLWTLNRLFDANEHTPDRFPTTALEEWPEFVNQRVKVHLRADSSPASFSWRAVAPDGRTVYNGGLIYFGPTDGWEGADFGPLSVRIGPAWTSEHENPWSLHS